MPGFVATCTSCFAAVRLSKAEADERIDGMGYFVCDDCRPLEEAVDRLARLHDEREGRRLWAAMMLARDVKTLEAIRLGLPVSRHRLDRKALLRAARGAPLVASDWIWITPEMLDAVDEGGPFR